VEAKGLSKAYGASVAGDGIPLEVRPGEISGLIGPNGAGKTTRIECPEDPPRPDTGRVLSCVGGSWPNQTLELIQGADAMEPADSYAFPFCHRIGRKARAFLASRYWILAVLLLAALLYFPFLFSGFFQDDYGFRLQFSPEIYQKGNVPAEVAQNSVLNLYAFSWNSSARLPIEQEIGFAPWWASSKIWTNFFRPLSSLTLALDFTLWPNAPWVMHLHSLLWFFLMIVLAFQLYRSVSGSTVVAGLGILLLAADSAFTGPAGWISNRHAVIAMVFSVLTVWLYHRGASKHQWAEIAGACGAYVLALLASEMGLVAFAYLLAYFLAMDRDRWRGRMLRLAPFFLITVIWRLVYTWLGYGSSGTLLYVDPILNPVDFLVQMLTRYPVLLFSAVGVPLADLLLAFSPWGAAWVALLSLIPLGILALAVYPIVKNHRTSAFWTIGVLAAVVPLVSGIPQNRNLGLVGLGAMGLVGQLLVDVATAPKPGPFTRFQRVLLRIIVPILLVLYLVVSPIIVITNPSSTRMMAQAQASAGDIGTDPALAHQYVYMINPPGAMSPMAGLNQRLFTDEPYPLSINYLSSGFSPVRIERLDAQTIVVTPDGGYTPLPGAILDRKTGQWTDVHLDNVYRALDEFFYNPRYPMRVGQAVALREVTVRVTAMTDDGRIAQASFHFDHPLEDSRYVWLLWNEDTSTYQRVSMPSVREMKVYP
jgi:hypothetical protein